MRVILLLAVSNYRILQLTSLNAYATFRPRCRRLAGTRPSRTGGNAVADQVGQPSIEADTPGMTWVKSSASSGSVPDCVEVARTPGYVHVRDSKYPDPRLSLTRESWRAFLRSDL